MGFVIAALSDARSLLAGLGIGSLFGLVLGLGAWAARFDRAGRHSDFDNTDWSSDYYPR